MEASGVNFYRKVESRDHVSKCERHFRFYLAELLGTFTLTFIDAGIGVVGVLTGSQIDLTVKAFAPGLTVLAMIFALGEVSGAHINPAVTISFALRGVFPWRRVPGYVFMQLTGAVLAALILRTLFGVVGDLGATTPLKGLGPAIGFEFILSSFLIFVILATSHQSKVKGPEAALPVAAAIIMGEILAKAISGASFNPARSFGPAVVSGRTADLWIYLIFPILGGAVSVLLVRLVHGLPKEKDQESAQGSKNEGAT